MTNEQMAAFKFSLTRKVHRLSVIEMEGDVTVEAESKAEARRTLLEAIEDSEIDNGAAGIDVNWVDVDEDIVEEQDIDDIAIDEEEEEPCPKCGKVPMAIRRLRCAVEEIEGVIAALERI